MSMVVIKIMTMMLDEPITQLLPSFPTGLIMVGVILASRKCRINPDNVATPIAASLGDLTTLGLLAWIASVLYSAKGESKLKGSMGVD